MTLTANDRKLRGESRLGTFALGLVTWVVALTVFFPVFWMVLNSFKTEVVANARDNRGTAHFIGLLSDGNVHSHIDHLLSQLLYPSKIN